MHIHGRKIFLTGGAGFIGSHLAEKLLGMENEVVVFDNFSSGKAEFLDSIRSRAGFTLIRGDLLKDDLASAMKGCDCVFHLAANPDVRLGIEDSRVHLDQNLLATYSLLEAMRKMDVKEVLFTSTSTVYGEADVIPTPENYGPLIPISLYGSSKLGCEAMISAYCYTFDMRSAIFRFANIVGPRSTHGVIFDFVNKLRGNSRELEILGREPGTEKSYCYIDDCVSGLIEGWKFSDNRVSVYNIGSKNLTTVRRIADIVCEEMGLENVRYLWTGGVDDGRGWKGDVRTMLLSIEKLKALGWEPRYGSDEAVRLATKSILSDC